MQLETTFNRCLFCGQLAQERLPEQPPKPNKPASIVERIDLFFLEIIAPSLTLKDISTVSKANSTWRNNIVVNTKKYNFTDKQCSFLTHFRIQKALYNSEKNPMTISRMIDIANLAKTLGLKIISDLHMRHFRWSEDDYHTAVARRQQCQGYRALLLIFCRHDRSEIARQVEGCGLAQLKHFKALQSLKLTGSGIHLDPAIFMQITCLSETLERLSVGVHHLKDPVLQALRPLSRLKHLSLASPYFTDAGLNVLSYLTALQSMSFGSCTFTGSGLSALKGCTELRTLKFEACNSLTNTHVAQLTHLTALHNLAFIHCTFKEDTIPLERFTLLQRLSLQNCDMTDDNIGRLRTLTDLRSLELSLCPKITGPGLIQLTVLTKLRALDISHTSVDEASLIKFWQHCPLDSFLGHPPPAPHPLFRIQEATMSSVYARYQRYNTINKWWNDEEKE